MFKKIILVFSMFLSAGVALAGGESIPVPVEEKQQQLSTDELKTLFTDRTQHCDKIGKDDTCKTYNAPNGRVYRVMDKGGARKEGSWWITDDDEYCVRWDSKKKKKNLCFAVFKQADGTYDLFKKGKHKAKVRKFIDGNSENM